MKRLSYYTQWNKKSAARRFVLGDETIPEAQAALNDREAVFGATYFI